MKKYSMGNKNMLNNIQKSVGKKKQLPKAFLGAIAAVPALIGGNMLMKKVQKKVKNDIKEVGPMLGMAAGLPPGAGAAAGAAGGAGGLGAMLGGIPGMKRGGSIKKSKKK
jgi:hypothetical protein